MVKRQAPAATNGLTLESSLQSFFFDQLQSLNEKSSTPLPKEAVYYSSLVMDRFGEAEKYFELEEGRVKEKVLGIKLLETNNLPRLKQKKQLKDIGDTALFLCGYFAKSLSHKIVDTRYYQDIGVMAYRRLDKIVPDVYDIPSFFTQLSNSFLELTTLMNLVAKQFFDKNKEMADIAFILKDNIKIKAS